MNTEHARDGLIAGNGATGTEDGSRPLTAETLLGIDRLHVQSRPADAKGARRSASKSIAAADALGATRRHVLTLYIPSRDRVARVGGRSGINADECGRPRPTWLAEIGGAVTILPPAEGGWMDDERGEIVWEEPVCVYRCSRSSSSRTAPAANM